MNKLGTRIFFLIAWELKQWIATGPTNTNIVNYVTTLSPHLFITNDIFIQYRMNHAVPYRGNCCYPCKLSHDNLGKSERFHFHCPVCQCTILNRDPFIKHLKLHDLKETPQTHGELEMDNKRGSNETAINKDYEESKMSKKNVKCMFIVVMLLATPS